MRIPSHSVSKLARSFFIAHFVDLQNSLHDDEIFFHRLVHMYHVQYYWMCIGIGTSYPLHTHTYSTDTLYLFVVMYFTYLCFYKV